LAGYSGTPLPKKLGLKPGYRALIIHTPQDYDTLLGELPDGLNISYATELPDSDVKYDFLHYFTTVRAELERDFALLKSALASDGLLWISWPKGASKVATDLNENIVREIGLHNGLVDVKVAAIDATWSGLKFVFRLKDRPSA
jgi:hypothetical protein